ncbi:MAG: thermonuclease family protein [Alphaproteobacteria bacterium]|nr:thermonuclease family protein [Alphaproteobacteria bacterium]
MRRALLLLVPACYTPPDLPVTPFETPILVDGTFEVCASERAVRVACTVDGDTVDLASCGSAGERVRLLGIDAPETAKPGEGAQCGADEAAAFLARVVDHQIVRVGFDATCTDVYDRTLAYLWLDRAYAERALDAQVLEDVVRLHGADPEDPVLLSTYLLAAGWARRFDEDWVEPLRFERELQAAERLARVRGAGVWGTCD